MVWFECLKRYFSYLLYTFVLFLIHTVREARWTLTGRVISAVSARVPRQLLELVYIPQEGGEVASDSFGGVYSVYAPTGQASLLVTHKLL